jgi:hypothetical protein
MASLLPPTLAKASAALDRALLPIMVGGSFQLQLLDSREALVIMRMFEVSATAYKYIDGVWASVLISLQGTTDFPAQPANRSVFICFSVIVRLEMDDYIFLAEWQSKHNDEAWPRVRTVTQTFNPEDRRKTLTVSTQLHPDLVNTFLEYEDHKRVWEAQLSATLQLAETPAPTVELIGKV